MSRADIAALVAALIVLMANWLYIGALAEQSCPSVDASQIRLVAKPGESIVRGQFVLLNNSKGSIALRLRPTCSCALIEADRVTLAPFAQHEVSIEMDLSGVEEERRAHVQVVGSSGQLCQSVEVIARRFERSLMIRPRLVDLRRTGSAFSADIYVVALKPDDNITVRVDKRCGIEVQAKQLSRRRWRITGALVDTPTARSARVEVLGTGGTMLGFIQLVLPSEQNADRRLAWAAIKRREGDPESTDRWVLTTTLDPQKIPIQTVDTQWLSVQPDDPAFAAFPPLPYW